MRARAFQEKIKIIANEKLNRDYFKLTLVSKKIASSAIPGQFVEIKVNDSDEPLLRRPLGIHKIKGRTFDVLCEIVGKGTKILSEKKRGDYLDVIGPLGKGFDLAKKANKEKKRKRIIVAGGMGVAPLIFLAQKLNNRKSLVLIGAKTKNQILSEKEFQALGYSVKISTDDGSQGFKGKVTDLLKKILPLAISKAQLAIYACGPKAMLKEISYISQEYSIPAQISLEEHMACGIGACLGCVVNTTDGYKRVCKEGPVFEADKIIW